MNRVRTEINESLSSVILFLKLFKTFEIGELVYICQLLSDEPMLYDDKVFSKLLSQFILQVNEESRKNHNELEHFGLMITESLIYNLYCHYDRTGMNNSMYSNSLMLSSSSNIGFNDTSTQSIRQFDSAEDHTSTNFTSFVSDFVNDSDLMKKLKQMVERGARKAKDGINQNQRYTDILFETIEYILCKDGNLDKNGDFEQLKLTVTSKNTVISSHFEKKSLKTIIKEVNQVIFSSKLNRIVFLLEEADPTTYFSLIRIYFGQSPREESRNKREAKYYSNISYGGEDMLINLTWIYVESISNKNELFEGLKNPLYRLIETYLLCFYMPVFRKFNEIVAKCCKYDFDSDMKFYEVCEPTINKDLCEFVEMLPGDLTDYLRQIYRIIIVSEQKSSRRETNISSIAVTGVKKLLIYSLLAKSSLIENFYCEGDLSKYEESCNYLINLFFRSSLKKYQNFEYDLTIISALTKSISHKLDEKIIGNASMEEAVYFDFERPQGLKSYILEAPILNADYETLSNKIKSIDFSPKDLKEFEMKKKSELNSMFENIQTSPTSNASGSIAVTMPNLHLLSPKELWNSPVNMPKKDYLEINESVDYFENVEDVGQTNKQDVDFLTWMTIGGNKDYGSKISQQSSSKASWEERKNKGINKFETFPKEKIKEICRLYSEYESFIA